MPELIIQESPDDGMGPKVVYAEGFIDSSTASVLKNKFTELLSKDTVKIILDCAKISYLGSAGISVILEFAGTFQLNGGALALCSVPEKALKVITMVGVEHIVRIFQTQKDALAFFQGNNEPADEKKEEQLPAAHQNIPHASFPLTITCPQCKQSALVSDSDIYRCYSCGRYIYISVNGSVFLLSALPDTSIGKGAWFSIRIPSNIVYLNSIRTFITSVLGEQNLAEHTISDIELSVDESVSNVMEHAYGMDKTKHLDIHLLVCDEYCMIKICDTGNSFDLMGTLQKEEDVVDSNSKRGRGCFIINKIMNKVEYKSIPEVGNILTMLKYYQSIPSPLASS